MLKSLCTQTWKQIFTPPFNIGTTQEAAESLSVSDLPSWLMLRKHSYTERAKQKADIMKRHSSHLPERPTPLLLLLKPENDEFPEHI